MLKPTVKAQTPADPPVMGFLDPKVKKTPKQLTRYGFLFSLPQSQIAFANAGGGNYSGAVKFDVAAFDSDGNLAPASARRGRCR